jgi:hypothetical protein
VEDIAAADGIRRSPAGAAGVLTGGGACRAA